jgi:TPR repeat protein
VKSDRSTLSYARAWAYRSRDPVAWSSLAAVYATADPPDLKRARQWYRRAALKEDERGMFEYGLMLIQGEGGPRRPANGRRYLERAAARGQVDALKVLLHGVSSGRFGYRPSRTRADATRRALRRAMKRQNRPMEQR